MATNKDFEIIGQILKETVRISSNEANFNLAVQTILGQISATNVDTYVFTHPNLTFPLWKASQKPYLAFQLELVSSEYHPLLVKKPDPVKVSIEETLKGLPKKLPVLVDQSKLTKEQLKLIRQIRYNCIKKRFVTSTGMSAGLSLVFNVGDLIKGNFTTYVINVAKDTGIAASSTLVGVALDGVPILAEGAGVIVLGIIDLTKAINNGDWTRFGLNLGLNTCATVGAVGGGKAGAAIGTILLPGAGTVIGTGLGLLIGGIGGRFLAGKTPLGNLIKSEIAQKIKEVYNEKFKEFGLEIDPNLSLDQIIAQSEIGQFKVIQTADLVGSISAETIKTMIPTDVLNNLLEIATKISPEDRTAGLIKIFEILKRI